MKLDFKDFFLNENKQILGHKVGDILTSVQDLTQNAQNMGTRLLVKRATTVVNMIRRILHAPWNDENLKYLKKLQKVGVAIMKAIDEKDDLPSVIAGCESELEKLSQKMHVPVHNLGSDQTADSGDDGLGTSQPPQPEAGSQPGQMPPPGGQPGAPPGIM
jgi:hypothetical protein